MPKSKESSGFNSILSNLTHFSGDQQHCKNPRSKLVFISCYKTHALLVCVLLVGIYIIVGNARQINGVVMCMCLHRTSMSKQTKQNAEVHYCVFVNLQQELLVLSNSLIHTVGQLPRLHLSLHLVCAVTVRRTESPAWCHVHPNAIQRNSQQPSTS